MFKSLSLSQKIIIQGILLLIGTIYVVPLWNVVALSFHADGWRNYEALLHTGMPIVRMFGNSVLVAVLQVLVIVAVSSLAAFSFSKLHYRGKTIFYTLVMLTMSIPMISLMTPLFTILKNLRAMNTFFALVFPSATLWMPVAILIQKNYYDSIGNEMMEAAFVDGCPWFKIFKDIYFPMGLPATVNVIVFAFMNAWNDYLNPLLFSKTMDMYTFPMAVISVTTTIRGSRPEVVAACLVVMALPSLGLYLGLQKYLGEGMTAGGVKG